MFLLALAVLALASPHQAHLDDPSESSLLPRPEAKELLYLHRNLVEIPSLTDHEQDVGKWLAHYLDTHGFNVELQEVSPKRYNVLAYGKKRSTTILVTSHIDTVPPYWPYYYDETTGIIGGRGSVDAKGSVAPQIIAVQGLREQLDDGMSLLFVVGEETGGDGMRAFSDWDERPHYDIVIFGEPTEGKLVCGHKGILGFTIKATGKAAHSGYPWLGVSANDIMIEALGKLYNLRDELPWSEKYGNTTLNFGRMKGGVAGNVVAEKSEAGIAIRLAAGTPQLVRGMILGALEEVKEKAEKIGGTLELDWQSEGYPPVDIDCDIEGFEKLTVNYGTDVPNLKGEHKRFLYGPGSIFVAHSDHEALKKKELELAVLDYRRLIVAASKMDHQERMEM
jgi:acetylornithine deacetylase